MGVLLVLFEGREAGGLFLFGRHITVHNSSPVLLSFQSNILSSSPAAGCCSHCKLFLEQEGLNQAGPQMFFGNFTGHE